MDVKLEFRREWGRTFKEFSEFYNTGLTPDIETRKFLMNDMQTGMEVSDHSCIVDEEEQPIQFPKKEDKKDTFFHKKLGKWIQVSLINTSQHVTFTVS